MFEFCQPHWPSRGQRSHLPGVVPTEVEGVAGVVDELTLRHSDESLLCVHCTTRCQHASVKGTWKNEFLGRISCMNFWMRCTQQSYTASSCVSEPSAKINAACALAAPEKSLLEAIRPSTVRIGLMETLDRLDGRIGVRGQRITLDRVPTKSKARLKPQYWS